MPFKGEEGVGMKPLKGGGEEYSSIKIAADIDSAL